MANLALHAIAMGADKIPDKAFHAVPGGFFRPSDAENPLKKKKKKKKHLEKETDGARDSHSKDRNKNAEKQRAEGEDSSARDRDRDRKKAQHNYEDSDSESDTTEDEEPDIEHQPRQHNRSHRPSSHLDRSYSSDGSAIMTHDHYRPVSGPAPPPTNYFPPPPVAPVDEDLFQPKKYSPTQYGASPGERDHYYSDHPKEQQPYPAAYQEPPPPTAENISTKRSMPADMGFARTQAPSPTPTTYFPQQPLPQVQPQPLPFRSRPISGRYIPHAEYMAPQNTRPYAAGVPPAFVPAPTFANGPAPRVFQPQPAGYPAQPSYVPPTDTDYKPIKDRDRERGDRGDRDRDRDRERDRDKDRDRRSRGDRDRRSSRHTSRRQSRSTSRSPSHEHHRRHQSSRGHRDSEHRHRSRSRDRDRKSKSHRTSRASSRKGSTIKSSGLGALAGGLLGKELGAGKLGSLVTAALGGASANEASKEPRSKSRRRDDDDREPRRRSSRDDRDKYEGKVQYGGGDYDADGRKDDSGRGDKKSKEHDGGRGDRRPHRSGAHRQDYYDSEGYDSD